MSVIASVTQSIKFDLDMKKPESHVTGSKSYFSACQHEGVQRHCQRDNEYTPKNRINDQSRKFG